MILVAFVVGLALGLVFGDTKPVVEAVIKSCSG